MNGKAAASHHTVTAANLPVPPRPGQLNESYRGPDALAASRHLPPPRTATLGRWIPDNRMLTAFQQSSASENSGQGQCLPVAGSCISFCTLSDQNTLPILRTHHKFMCARPPGVAQQQETAMLAPKGLGRVAAQHRETSSQVSLPQL